MKILVIGGTSFVGRHIVEEALKKEHAVTLFNRGKSNPDLFSEVPRITGDRRKAADKLEKEKWDAVIDTSAYTPSDLLPVLKYISTDHYTFISTISVYDDFSKGPVKENSSIHMGIEGEEVTGETYGPLKVTCEKLVEDRFPDNSLIIRPGIVAGPHDPTDRFTYWALKLNEGGEVLIPGSRSRKVQWIDAQDLAAFTISNIENRTNGTFNLAANPVTMEELVKNLASPDLVPLWVSDQILLDAGIKPFRFPLWIPVTEDYPEGFILADNTKAKEMSWKPRGLAETAEAVREWKKGSSSSDLTTAIDAEQENKIRVAVENDR
ncbi:NAD-dependent epimerase/dehydratase family protein [Planococcus halotolerans]|uniref:NAD-dependent epimerase/dehydratase family protein n=1 Tax=Planococcus halotolerans TaxID=2233542 RepID=UPI001092F826|nr:NAD-dependent epimerase/dehydratase family protein [Planococcus halotolerans]QHJ70708.1 NAD-dependent epimerase/dehydratase family protein [Planococcus halotolerans]